LHAVPIVFRKSSLNSSNVHYELQLLEHTPRVVSLFEDCLCDLVVRVPGYRSRGPGSISGATRFSEKHWVWNAVHSAS
jgi:hypothetical protein